MAGRLRDGPGENLLPVMYGLQTAFLCIYMYTDGSEN